MSTNTFLRPGIDFAAFGTFLADVYAARNERRCTELEAHAFESGIQLPMPPETVVMFEDAGGVVDLLTGWITWPGGIRTMPAVVEAKERA